MNIQHIREQYLRMGKNFMTPKVRDWTVTSDNRVLELSEGHGIAGEKIYGVSEFEMIDGKLRTTKRGQMHRSATSARSQFNNLMAVKHI